MASDADHQIFPIDKTDDDVHLISDVAQLISDVAQLISVANQIDDVGLQTSNVHKTSAGAKAFHLDHAAHGCNNENQLNDALGKMNKLLNSMRRDL